MFGCECVRVCVDRIWLPALAAPCRRGACAGAGSVISRYDCRKFRRRRRPVGKAQVANAADPLSAVKGGASEGRGQAKRVKATDAQQLPAEWS